MKTKTEIRATFWRMLRETAPDLAKMKFAKKTQNDIRCRFVDYIDQLARSGQITQTMADNVTL